MIRPHYVNWYHRFLLHYSSRLPLLRVPACDIMAAAVAPALLPPLVSISCESLHAAAVALFLQVLALSTLLASDMAGWLMYGKLCCARCEPSKLGMVMLGTDMLAWGIPTC